MVALWSLKRFTFPLLFYPLPLVDDKLHMELCKISSNSAISAPCDAALELS